MKSYLTLILIFFSNISVFSQSTADLTIKSNKEIPKGYYLNIQNNNYSLKQGDIAFQKTFMIENPEYGYLISPRGKLFTFWFEEGEC